MFGEFFESLFADDSIKLRSLDELRRTRRGNDYLYADADLAAIEEAKAEYYPKVALDGYYGFQNHI